MLTMKKRPVKKTAAVEKAKKIKSDKHQSLLRRGKISREKIVAHIEFLKSAAADLEKAVKQLEKNGISELDQVDGVTKFFRGSKEIALFVANVNRSIVDQKFDR